MLGKLKVLATASVPIIAVIVLAGGLLAVFFWQAWPQLFPNAGRDREAAASVAAATVAAAGAILSVGVKHAFDSLAERSRERSEVQRVQRERLHEYVLRILNPLVAVAGDLSVKLREAKTERDRYGTGGAITPVEVDSHSRQFECFYDLCRYTALFSALRNRLSLPPPLPAAPGIILNTHKAEETVWSILPEPWSFGLDSGVAQATAVRAVVSEDGRWEPINRFAAAVAADEVMKQLYDKVRKTLDDKQLNALSVIFRAVNAVLDTEIRRFYQSWYGSAPTLDKSVLADVGKIDSSMLRDLGVRYDPTHPLL